VTATLAETRWLIDPDIAYLNHGGYGALPVPVAQAAEAIRREVEGDPTRLLMVANWRPRLDEIRRRLASFLRAEAEDLVFVPNATTGTANVLASFDWQPGDHVVTTDHRYPAVGSQVGALRDRRGVEVTEVPIALDIETTAAIVDQLITACTYRTKLIVVDHIASPTGFVFPVKALVRSAHEKGIPVLVDAAHAPGQLDVDLTDIDADFWVGNLHKWVCSPRAAAVMRVAPQWQPLIRPSVPSNHYGEGFQAAFDWIGTLDPVPLLTVPATLDYWDGIGWADVRHRQHALATDGAQHIAERLGTRVVIADEFTAAMRLIELPVRLSGDQLVTMCQRLIDRHGVTVYLTGHQQHSYARVCGQLYNQPADYERLADALREELA
jgi:isopenicillin-N epimerase